MGKRKCNSKYRAESPESHATASPIVRETLKGFDAINDASGSHIRGKQSLKSVYHPFEISNSPDNLHSPYHLLGSDHPGLALVSEQLDGTNYGTWVVAMTTSLEAKNKTGFIDGSIGKPDEDDPYCKIWCRCNSMVKAWLLNSVSKQIYTSVLYFKVAADIWKDLHTRFHKSNLPRLYKLRHQLHSLRQGHMDLSTYHTLTQTYWEELSSLQVTVCTVEGLMAERETNRVIDFLMGLNENYDHIRSQILMKKTLPTLSEVFNILDQEDSQRTARFSSSSAIEPAAFQVASKPYYGNQKSKPVCSHCGMVGHIIDRCYKIHGYPPGIKPKGKFQYQKRESMPAVSTNMVHKDHIPNDSMSSLSQPQNASASLATSCNQMSQPFSQEQMQQMIAFFSSQLHNQSITSPPNDGLLATPSAVPSTSKVSGSYTGIDDWQG